MYVCPTMAGEMGAPEKLLPHSSQQYVGFRTRVRPMMDVKIAFAEKTLAAVIVAKGFLVRVRCGDGG